MWGHVIWCGCVGTSTDWNWVSQTIYSLRLALNVWYFARLMCSCRGQLSVDCSNRQPTPLAVRSKAWVCVRSFAGIVGSNPAGCYGCLCLGSVVCCQVEVSVSGWSLVQRNLTECGLSECDREASTIWRPWPTSGCWVMGKIEKTLNREGMYDIWYIYMIYMYDVLILRMEKLADGHGRQLRQYLTSSRGQRTKHCHPNTE